MKDFGWLQDLLQNFGAGALVTFVFWKVVDKWAGQFLDAEKAQASSVAGLADAVKDAQTDQREVLIAVRVLGREIETQKEYLVEIEDAMRKADIRVAE